MTVEDAIRAFEDALRTRGIIPPRGGIRTDGKIQRCAVEGTPHKKDASILFYADPPISGGFQNWRDGKGWENWTYWNGKEDRAKLTEEEVLAAKARQEKIKKAREQDRAKRQKEAAEEAQQIWEAAGPAEPLHPYLAKKKIEPNGLRMNGDGRLLAAMMDESNTLVNLQKIDARGEKRFHPGGKVAGTFSSFGPAPDPSGTIVIVEGIATGASVFEATGLSVISAMSADNLLAVTKIFRKRFPKAKLIIFADNDTQETHGHTLGVDAAEGAANATGAYIAISSTPGDDANDLYAREGAEAVRASITAARTTEIQDPEMDETGDQAEDIPPKKSDITISRSSPLKTAKSFIKLRYQHGAARTLHFNGGLFYGWTGKSYVVATEERIKSELYAFLSETKVWVRKPSMEILSEEGSDAWTWETTSYNPKRKNVGEVLDALKAIAYHANALPPKWLEECDGSVYPEAELIAFDNGVLHVPTDTFLKHSPLFFNINSVPFDYNAEAGDPVEWNKFLDDLWADDLESRDTLQEIMGLLLLPETKHQKIFGIVGPKRAGKGVIARVVRGLLGAENVAAPTLASLSTNFGLSSLIGKRAAIISDARLSGRADQHTIAERLLSISGEDAIDIDRKYLQVWTGTLSVRFLILTNEVPRIADTSGALPSRLIFLEMKESFYGREDLGLTTKLLNELPNIALWAIQGWKRLQERGYFLQPSAALDIIRVMEDLSSPVGAFVRDCCDMGVGKEIVKKQMFKAYQLWSKDGGKTITASDATFGRDLLAATHRKVTSRQPIGSKSGERPRVYAGITLVDDWLARVKEQERLEVLEALQRKEKAERQNQ